MAQKTSKRAEDQLLLALACGATVEAAARQAGLSESTAHRRLADSGFRSKLERLRTELVERTMGMLTGAAGEAVKTLVSLMHPSAPPPAHLGAARATLEIGMKLREVHDLQTRVALLEAQIRPGPRLAQGTES